MIWELTDEIRIRVIPLNFVLECLREGGINPKTGERGAPKWEVAGYYSSLEKAISALPSEVAQHPEIQTFGDLTARLNKLGAQLARRVGH